MLPFLFACQKENISPLADHTSGSSDISSAVTSCTEFSYMHKDFGKVEFGNATGHRIYVSFTEQFPQNARYAILSSYASFDAIESEAYADYTLITTVRLKNGTTCNEVEDMLLKLKKHQAVLSATPSVNDPNGYSPWLGLTNEVLVFFDGEDARVQFEALAKKSHTKILDMTPLFDEFYQAVLSADKYSAGDALAIATLFNEQPYVLEAVPNFLFSQQSGDMQLFSDSTPELTTTAAEVKVKGRSATMNTK